jgi:hypothetical protein
MLLDLQDFQRRGEMYMKIIIEIDTNDIHFMMSRERAIRILEGLVKEEVRLK